MTKYPKMSLEIVPESESRNRIKAGVKNPGYKVYELPYPMNHVLEAERWLRIFHAEPVYSEVKDHLNNSFNGVEEGEINTCETCSKTHTLGFDPKDIFTQEEYERILQESRACSIDCAIKYISGEYGPTVDEFKSNPEEYKQFGGVNHTVQEVLDEYYL